MCFNPLFKVYDKLWYHWLGNNFFFLHAAVNHVQWHPHDSHVFMSCGFDGFIKVFDCRAPSKPLISVNDHGNNQEPRFVHRPCFYSAGETILTSGDGRSHITQYATQRGSVIAQHDLHVTRAPCILECGERSDMVVMSLTGESLLKTLSARWNHGHRREECLSFARTDLNLEHPLSSSRCFGIAIERVALLHLQQLH